jgi:benzylsuccinate CoA-transferase BbsF subunit
MTEQLPFEGLKVADFSWVAVGPITSKYLGDHGATVVRVETESRPDILRVAGPFKDGVPGPNRSHFYGDFNSSKVGLSLDLKNPAGLDIACRLIEWADVYFESFTPGTMDALGMGYEKARSINPSILMVSTCLMGQTGSARSFAGYGFHAGAIAGYYDITGWPDLPPDGPWTAYTDVVSPRFISALVMAALDHRRRTGQGQHIDAAQMEMGLQFLAPQIIDYNASGKIVSRNGNRSDVAAPQGAYPCAGDDQWCAIAVDTEQQWEDLRQAMGGPEWAGDERFKAVEGRLTHHDEIDGHIGQWTKDKTPKEVMELLQSHGVPSGVVQRSSDLLQDPQLAHRNLYHYLDHAEMGNIPYTGHQFRIQGYDSGPRSPAPLLGQHNEYVLKDLLGMTDEDMIEAVIAGAIA